MPFSKTSKKHTEDYWTDHFSQFLKPLIEKGGNLEARRSQPLRGDILRQIITDLVVSSVIVADLTDHNPNVYWELGVRQSFKHGTITIAESGTKLPFDIGGKSTLFYHPKDHVKMEHFRCQFEKALEDCLSHPDRPDSHVLETISGRGTLFELYRRDEAIRRIDALLSELEVNESNLKIMVDQAKKNREDPHNRGIPYARLMKPSIELLLTERYLNDAADVLYRAASIYYRFVNMTSDQLNLWDENPSGTEAFLLSDDAVGLEVIPPLRRLLEKAKSELKKTP